MVRNVIDHRRSGTGGMLCCHTARAAPPSTYADRGANSCSYTRRSPPTRRWNRIMHAERTDTPTTTGPNIGALAR